MNKTWLKVIKFSAIFFVAGFFFFGNADSAFANACQSNTAAVTWTTAGHWTNCGGTTPQTTDTIEILNGHTVTLGAARQVAGVQINSGGAITGATFLLTVTGTGTGVNGLTVNGTWTGSGGALVNGSGATIDGTASIANTGTITLTNNKTIASTASLTFAGTIALSAATNVTNNGSVTLNAAATSMTGANATTSIWTQGTNSTLILNGTASLATGTLTATASGNTINYKKAGVQTGKVATYVNLTLSGTSAKTFATTPTVNGILTLEGTATITVTTGVVTYGAAGGLKYNTTTSRSASTEEWLATFAGTGGVTISSTGAITPGAAKVFSASVNLTVDSGATISPGSSQLTFNGNFVNNGTYTSGTNAIVITGTATQSIGSFTTSGAVSMTKTAGTATFTGNVTGGSLTINGSGGTLNAGNQLQSHVFSGVATLTAGTFNGGSALISFTVVSATAWSGTGSVFTAGTSHIFFGAAGAQNNTTSATFYNLTLEGSGIKTMNSLTTVNGNLALRGTATYTTGGSVSIGGDLMVGSGTTLTTGATNTWTLSVAGSTTVTGTLTLNNNANKSFTGPVNVGYGGAMTVVNTATITFQGGFNNNTNAGTVTIAAPATFNTNSQSINGMTGFVPLSQTALNWYDLSVENSTSDVYAVASGGGIYVQAAGSGNFTSLNQSASLWRSVSVNQSNGDVYASVYTGDIYKCTNASTDCSSGTPTFSTVAGTASKNWRSVLYNNYNSTLYGVVGGSYNDASNGIFTISGGVLTNVGPGAYNWRDIAVNTTNGNVYATDYGGDIWMQTASTGAFTQINQTDEAWYGISINNTSGDVYAVVAYGDIYKQTAGTGAFEPTANGIHQYQLSVGVNSSDNYIYTGLSFSGDIYKNNNSTSRPVTFSSTVTISGAITVTNSNTATTTVTGVLDGNNASSNWTQGANAFVSFSNATKPLNTNGTLTASASGNTVTYTGTAAAIKDATYNNLTINGAGSATIGAATIVNDTMTVTSAVTNNSTLTVTTALSGASTLTNSATGTLNIGGTSGITGLTATAVGNTVNYTGANQALKVVSYDNLTLSGSGTATGAVATVAGALVMSGSVAWADGAITSTPTSVTLSNTASLTLGANLATSGAITINGGTLNANNFNVSATSLSSSNSTTRTINMGSGTWTLTSTGTVWDVATATNLTVNGNTSTIKLTNTSATGKTFAGGGKTYNNIWFAPGAGTGTYTVSGSNTFADFKDDGTGAHTINFTASSTTTITSLTLDTNSSSLITLASTTPTTQWNLVDTTGTNTVSYVSITDSCASGGATWAADDGTNTNGGNNCGWVFSGSGISISGTANNTNANAVVKVSVAGAAPVSGAMDGSGATWTITGVTTPSVNDSIVVWVDNVADALESTAVTKWAASNISGMVLNPGVLTIGSNQNTSVSLTNLDTYDCVSGDEDVMYSVTTNVLNAEGQSCAGGSNSYTAETISVLASNTLDIATSETVTTEKITNAGTITATGSPTINLAGTSGTLFTKSGTFTQATSTVNVTGAGTTTLLSAATTFHRLTINNASATVSAGAVITMSNADTANRLYIQAGILDDGGSSIVGTTNGTMVMDSGTTLKIGSAGTASTFPTNYTNGIITLNSASTVTYQSGLTQTVSGVPTYGNLTIYSLSALPIMSLGAATTVSNNLTISEGSLQLADKSLTVTGTTSISTDGVLYDNSITGTNLFVGAVTITSNGAWSAFGVAAPFEFRGGLTNNGTNPANFDSGSGVYTFSTNAQTISGSQSFTITSLTNNVTTGNGLTFSGAQPTVTTLTQSSNAILEFSGTVPTITTLTASASGNLVKYTTTASQAIKGATYNDLTLTGATPTIGGTTVVNGTMTITGVTATNNSTLTVTTALSGTGGLTQGASSVLNLGGTSGITTLDASTNDNTVNYSATTGGQTIKSTTYRNLTLSNTSGTQTAGGALTVTTLNTTAGGTLNMVTYDLGVTNVTSNGIIKTQSVSGTPITTGKTWTGTVEYNSASAQTVVVGTYGNLTISTGGTKTLAGASSISASGTLTVSAGVFDPSTYLLTGSGTNTITIASGATLRVGASTFAGSYSAGFGTVTPASGSTIDYYLNGTQTIANGISYHHLVTSNGGVKTLAGNTTVAGDVTIGTSTTLDSTSGFTLTGSGTNVLNVTGTIRVQHSTFAGSYPSFETTTLNTGSVVDYYLNGTQTVDNTLSYYGLTISTGGTKSLNGTTTTTGTLTIGGGTLDVTGSNYTLNTANLTLTGGTFLPRSSTINLTGTGTVFNYSSGTYTRSGETLNLTDSSATDKTFAGGGRSFNKVVFTGTGSGIFTISGDNTFAIFRVENPPHTLNFTASSTQSVENWQVNGSPSNLITLNSTSNLTDWNLYLTPSNYGYGTYSSDYLSIRDSAASGNSYFSSIYAGSNSTDDTTGGSTNTGWLFVLRSQGGGGGGVESSATPDSQVGGGGQGGGGGSENNASGTCVDGIQNGDETGVDTGGRCTGNGGGTPGGGNGDVGYLYNNGYRVATVNANNTINRMLSYIIFMMKTIPLHNF